jgi:hypothetical protein
VVDLVGPLFVDQKPNNAVRSVQLPANWNNDPAIPIAVLNAASLFPGKSGVYRVHSSRILKMMQWPFFPKNLAGIFFVIQAFTK